MLRLLKAVTTTLCSLISDLIFERSGLAEAGLIPSKLSSVDIQSAEKASSGVRFSPDRYVHRNVYIELVLKTKIKPGFSCYICLILYMIGYVHFLDLDS